MNLGINMTAKEEALQLYELGWLPISNKYHIIAYVALNIDYAVALAQAESVNGDLWGSALYKDGDKRRGRQAMFENRLKHWRQFKSRDTRMQFARVFAESKTIDYAIYKELKKLCNAYNGE